MCEPWTKSNVTGFKVFQNKCKETEFILSVWRIAWFTQFFTQKTESTNQDTASVGKGVERVLAVVRTHSCA